MTRVFTKSLNHDFPPGALQEGSVEAQMERDKIYFRQASHHNQGLSRIFLRCPAEGSVEPQMERDRLKWSEMSELFERMHPGPP